MCIKEELSQTVPNLCLSVTGFIPACPLSLHRDHPGATSQFSPLVWVCVCVLYKYVCVCEWMCFLYMCAPLPPTIWALFGEIFCKNHSHAVAGLPQWKAAPGRNSVLLLLFPQMLKEVSGFPVWGAGFVFDLHGRPRLHVPFQKRQKNKENISNSHPARLQYHHITVGKQVHVCVRMWGCTPVCLHHIYHISMCFNGKPRH